MSTPTLKHTQTAFEERDAEGVPVPGAISADLLADSLQPGEGLPADSGGLVPELAVPVTGVGEAGITVGFRPLVAPATEEPSRAELIRHEIERLQDLLAEVPAAPSPRGREIQESLAPTTREAFPLSEGERLSEDPRVRVVREGEDPAPLPDPVAQGMFASPFGGARAGSPTPVLGRPVVDPSVPAPPPFGVEAGLEHVGLDDPFGAPPLVAPAPQGESSTPLYMREVKLDKALCRSCEHGWLTKTVEPTLSSSAVYLKLGMLCTQDRRNLRETSECTVLACSRYQEDPKRPVASLRPLREEMDELRKHHGLTAPPVAARVG